MFEIRMDLSHFSFFKFKIHSPNKSVSHTIDVEKKKKKKMNEGAAMKYLRKFSLM